MASPHVAGAVALVLQAHPAATVLQVGQGLPGARPRGTECVLLEGIRGLGAVRGPFTQSPSSGVLPPLLGPLAALLTADPFLTPLPPLRASLASSAQVQEILYGAAAAISFSASTPPRLLQASMGRRC